MKTDPLFPLYIVSKGRWDTRHTARALEQMGLHYYMIVEEQELERYAEHIPRDQLLVLPAYYKQEYELCDDLGLTKSTGPGPARNYAWDHSWQTGYTHHWVMDDNIFSFRRYHDNARIKCGDGLFFRCQEEFVLRYTNVAMAGPNYTFFVPRKDQRPPFVTNTRIYSCNLIQNNIPFRWRGRYNEDTILSLDILKSGLATVQFNAFLQEKAATQTIKGGNHADFYSVEGTKPKSYMLWQEHPDVTELVDRWDRAHHHVNYLPFKSTPLIKNPDRAPWCAPSMKLIRKPTGENHDTTE